MRLVKSASSVCCLQLAKETRQDDRNYLLLFRCFRRCQAVYAYRVISSPRLGELLPEQILLHHPRIGEAEETIEHALALEF